MGPIYGGGENLRTDNPDYNLGRSYWTPFGYLGMRRDRFTGLYHTQFREYDAVHGRWLSEDPAGYADGLNLYQAYMGVNGTDPLGLWNHDDMIKAYVEMYGEEGVQLLMYAFAQGYRIEERSYFSTNAEFIEAEGVIGIASWSYKLFKGDHIDDSNETAARRLHALLKNRYDVFLSKFMRLGMKLTTIPQAVEMGDLGYTEEDWVAILAVASGSGGILQDIIEDALVEGALSAAGGYMAARTSVTYLYECRANTSSIRGAISKIRSSLSKLNRLQMKGLLQEIRNVKKLLKTKQIKDIVKQATQNGDATEVVLGRFQGRVSYIQVAEYRKACYFYLDNWNEIASTRTLDEMWEINEAFLREQLLAEKTIILTHNPWAYYGNCFFQREINLLRELGYDFVFHPTGTWRAVK
ncbi:MAG: RHS repeat-associated core domain-containing protein, partial [Candidatus Babeliaceae bacterium]|nr:RHS repeat-associated core domain-containing protein [Candidatus Babeliaceae bacterium]